MNAVGVGCGHQNREGLRFCTGCGASLAPVCPSCAIPAEPGERFCRHCGAGLQVGAPTPLPSFAHTVPTVPAPPATESERKQVTVLFADMAGSMELAERLDALKCALPDLGPRGGVRELTAHPEWTPR